MRKYGPDSETRLITEEFPVPDMVSWAVGHEHGVDLYHHTDPSLPDVIRETARDGWMGANVAFDTFVAWRKFPLLLPDLLDAYDAGAIVDVLTECKLLSIAAGQRSDKRLGLGAACKQYLGWDLEKDGGVRLTFGDLIDVPCSLWTAPQVDYAKTDGRAHYCLGVMLRHVASQLPHPVLAPAPELACRSLVLHGMGLYGMATDQTKVGELSRRLQAEVDAFRRECIKHGLVREEKGKFVRKQAAVQAFLGDMAAQGVKVPRTPPSTKFPHGQWSTSQEAMEEMSIPRCELWDDVGRGEWKLDKKTNQYPWVIQPGDALDVRGGHVLDAYRRLGSRQTQLAKVAKRSGPIFRTNYDELKVTGRMGASGFSAKGVYGFWNATSDNGQNTPKEPGFRECQRARDGHLLVCSDWGAIELHTMAQIQLDWYNKSRLAEALTDGDPHSWMGAQLLGIPKEQFDRSIPEHDKIRGVAKIPNFGFLGLMGANRYQGHATKSGLDLSLAEAKHHKAAWEASWPESVQYLRDVCNARAPNVYKQGGGKLLVVGHRTGLVRGGCRAAEACNFGFQGMAARACGLALWWAFRARQDRRSPLFGVPIVLVVHDELVAEAPEHRAEEVKAELERLMLAALAVVCPDVPGKVDTKIVRNYEK